MDRDRIAHSVEQAARLSGIGRTKLYEAIKQGRLDARKFGKRTLIPADALLSFLHELPRAGANESDAFGPSAVSELNGRKGVREND